MPAYTQTLSDAKASELAEVSSACPSSSKFLSLLNQAQRRLMRRGSWFGTEVLTRLCVYNGCLTLPAYVATLTGLQRCDGSVARIFNHWYQIDKPWNCFGGLIVPRETGMAPTYNTVANPDGSPIRYHVLKQADIGKTITIFGHAIGGQPLMEKDADGNWREGITITAAAPFAQTSVLVQPGPGGITSIVRQPTQGMSYLYEVYDTGAGTLRALGTYGPNETNPRYRQYKLDGFCGGGCQDVYGRNITGFDAMVKLAWVPLVNDWDFLLVDNFDALKLMIQAVKFFDANEVNQGLAFEALAIREMQADDSTFQPDNQLTISVRTGEGVRNLM